jgi:hypothetical protein
MIDTRVVYSSKASPTRKMRRRLGVSASAFKGADGRWHTYLNAAVPRDTFGTIDDSLCRRCAMGYSHVMVERREICNECVNEDVAERAIRLQSLLGIDLGWRMPEDYTPEDWRLYANYQDRSTSQLDRRYGARSLSQQ